MQLFRKINCSSAKIKIILVTSCFTYLFGYFILYTYLKISETAHSKKKKKLELYILRAGTRKEEGNIYQSVHASSFKMNQFWRPILQCRVWSKMLLWHLKICQVGILNIWHTKNKNYDDYAHWLLRGVFFIF